MNRREVSLWSPAIGAPGTVLVYGHYGRPLLAFPSQEGPCWQYEERGMIAAIGEQIDGGRVKVYAVDSFDSASWHRGDLSLEERARQHARYEDWILNQVASFIHGDAGAEQGIMVTGVSASAPTTPRTSRSSAPTSSRSRSATAASTTSRSSAAANGATRPTSTTPPTTSRTSPATTSTGCAGA